MNFSQKVLCIYSESIATFLQLLLAEEVALKHEPPIYLCFIFKVGMMTFCLVRYLHKHSIDFIIVMKSESEESILKELNHCKQDR